MHENAPSHAFKWTTEFHAKHYFKGNQLRQWRSNSPDLNPTENLFSQLKSTLYGGGSQYFTKTNLLNGIKKLIAAINRKSIFQLTQSMDSRLIKVLENNIFNIRHKL